MNSLETNDFEATAELNWNNFLQYFQCDFIQNFQGHSRDRTKQVLTTHTRIPLTPSSLRVRSLGSSCQDSTGFARGSMGVSGKARGDGRESAQNMTQVGHLGKERGGGAART